MNDSVNFSPNWYSSPGDTINDILGERKIGFSEFAEQMGSNAEYVKNLLMGNIKIDLSIAEKLSLILGASTDFWVNREEQYRLSLERLNSQKMESWLSDLPVKEMIKFGWISGSSNLLNECLDFFNVKTVDDWERKYSSELGQLSFRTSKSFKSDIASVTSWLRRGEIITQDLKCKSWNKDLFVKKIDEIKKLTREKSPIKFLPELIRHCAECGVALAIVPTPKGCKASGASKFIGEDRALMLLSFRYLSDDHFWFTFFHEAGHLILHENKNNTYVEMTNKLDRIYNEKEEEANLFAAEALIPYTMHEQLKTIRSNKRKIIQFAQNAGISPGIVIGQMQFLGYIKPEYLNSYKRRYNWNEINAANLYES